jgi:hypothetical protein
VITQLGGKELVIPEIHLGTLPRLIACKYDGKDESFWFSEKEGQLCVHAFGLTFKVN